MKYVIGFDIGGTKLSASLCSVDGEEIRIEDKIMTPTPIKEGYKKALDILDENFHSLIGGAQINRADIRGVGISCGGPLDSQNGVILSPTNLPGWDEVKITEHFEKALQLPVALQNDANACALAEWKYGAGRGTRNMIFLTFGTGFGAGLILDGRLYSGTNDMAGEIGHVLSPIDETHKPMGYGKAGGFESYCSGGGISRLAGLKSAETGYTGGLSARELASAADTGDTFAADIYKTSGRHLGAALALFIDILNPEAIVIGSIYARSGKLLYDAMMETLEREALPISRKVCRILPSALGDELGDIAAASIACEFFLKNS